MKSFYKKIFAHADEQENNITHTIFKIATISTIALLVVFFHNGCALESAGSGSTLTDVNQVPDEVVDTVMVPDEVDDTVMVSGEVDDTVMASVLQGIIGTGSLHTCVIISTGIVKCWGSGGHGQLGSGSTDNIGDQPNELGDSLAAIDLGAGRSARQISAGFTHTCALLDTNQVKCWGSGGLGQLGSGSTDTIGDQPNELGDSLAAIDLGAGRSARQISAGLYHTCALLDTDQVKCWGWGAAGQLGSGSTDTIGDQPNELGDSLAAIDLGTGRSARQISAGSNHTCALLDTDQVKCWGSGGHGQLGHGSTDIIGDQPNELGDSLAAIDLGTGRSARHISAGSNHTCALLDTDQVKCWGHGTAGQLGNASNDNVGDQPNELGDSLAAIDLGASRSVRQISAGFMHTCALLDTNQVKCWGTHNNGVLGNGHTDNIGDDPGELGDALVPIHLGSERSALSISAKNNHTCLVLDNGGVKCWGAGGHGRLGSGGTDTIGDSVGELGDNLPIVDLGSSVAKTTNN